MKRKCKECYRMLKDYEPAMKITIGSFNLAVECLACKYFKKIDIRKYLREELNGNTKQK